MSGPFRAGFFLSNDRPPGRCPGLICSDPFGAGITIPVSLLYSQTFRRIPGLSGDLDQAVESGSSQRVESGTVRKFRGCPEPPPCRLRSVGHPRRRQPHSDHRKRQPSHRGRTRYIWPILGARGTQRSLGRPQDPRRGWPLVDRPGRHWPTRSLAVLHCWGRMLRR